MKLTNFMRGFLMFRMTQLSALILVTASCSSSTHDPPANPDASGVGGAVASGAGGTGASDAGGTSNQSYTTMSVTSACDDLSSADVLKLGTFSHVTAFTDLPFSFPLFGETATRFVITEQGQIFIGGFSLFVTTAGEPQQPPNAYIPNGWVAPFWDSRLTYLANDRGDVRVLSIGTGADERFVIGYNDFTLRFPSNVAGNPDVHLSFQVALLRQSQAIEFRYCQLDPGPAPSQELQDRVLGGAAGIALESSDGSRGVSFSFKTPLVQAGIAIRFTPAP